MADGCSNRVVVISRGESRFQERQERAGALFYMSHGTVSISISLESVVPPGAPARIAPGPEALASPTYGTAQQKFPNSLEVLGRVEINGDSTPAALFTDPDARAESLAEALLEAGDVRTLC